MQQIIGKTSFTSVSMARFGTVAPPRSELLGLRPEHVREAHVEHLCLHHRAEELRSSSHIEVVAGDEASDGRCGRGYVGRARRSTAAARPRPLGSRDTSDAAVAVAPRFVLVTALDSGRDGGDVRRPSDYHGGRRSSRRSDDDDGT